MFSISKEDLLGLAEAHILRFENFIHQAKQGAPGIREGECRHYLRIWQVLRDWALEQPNARVYTQRDLQRSLEPPTFSEVFDAWQDGSYEKYFKPS